MSKKYTSFYNKINKYFSKCEKNMASNIDLIKNYRYKFSIDNNGNNIVHLYNNNKLIMEAIYDIAGIYNLYNS